MITPQFSLNQDEDFLFVCINAPMCKLKDAEIHIEEDTFIFWAKPYYLRLTLPGKLSSDGQGKVTIDKTIITIKIAKAVPNEHFEGLGMITRLLTPPRKKNTKPAIEIVDSDPEKLDDIDEEIDWHLEQIEYNDSNTLLGHKYGFAYKYSGIFTRLQDEICDLLELKNPENKSNEERNEEKILIEKNQFEEDHYLADLYDEKGNIEYLINYKPHWEKNFENNLTQDEIFRLKNLPKREYIFSKREKFTLVLGLVDILCAYTYDIITTEGEHNVESGWTISKISSTLSWFTVFNSLEHVFISFIRRSLSYPIYRSWDLSIRTIKSVYKILRRGRTCVVKCLLDIHKIFNESGDYRYIFNDLYITDYCVWIQNLKENTFRTLADAFGKFKISKASIGLDLDILEATAKLALQQEKLKA